MPAYRIGRLPATRPLARGVSGGSDGCEYPIGLSEFVQREFGESGRITVRRALLVVALVLLGACSDSDDSDDDAGREETTTTDSEGNTGDPEHQAIADAAVLTLDDMPTGWEAAPPEDEEQQEAEEDDADQAMADCLDIDVSELQGDSPTADSRFVNSDDEQVSSEVTVAASETEVQAGIDRIRDEAGQSCFLEVIQYIAQDSFASDGDIEVGEATFNELSFEDLGDDSIAFRLTVPISSQGIDVDLYVDYVLVRKGRAGVQTSFHTVFTPFDAAQALELTETVVDRIPTDA